jgi:hypothetical protein
VQAITVLYTHNLRGDLDLLPRLFTFIQKLRTGISGKSVLVDLGASCAPEVWPCAITGGRSTLLALDAMGYDTANVTGVLSAESREKLAGQIMIALVDEEHSHVRDDVLFTVMPEDDGELFQIILAPAETTTLEGRTLRLAGIKGGQVGMAKIEGGSVQYEVHAVPPNTPPDATIAGVVDFIRSEARYYGKKQE